MKTRHVVFTDSTAKERFESVVRTFEHALPGANVVVFDGCVWLAKAVERADDAKDCIVDPVATGRDGLKTAGHWQREDDELDNGGDVAGDGHPQGSGLGQDEVGQNRVEP